MDPEHYKYMPHIPGSEPESAASPEPESAPEGVPASPALQNQSPIVGQELPARGKALSIKGEALASGLDQEETLTAVSSNAFMQFLYDIFNPFLIPAYCTLLMFELSVLGLSAPSIGISYALIVLGLTCIFPFAGILVLRGIHAVDSIALQSRKERFYPYILMLIGVAATTVFLAFRGAPQWMLDVYLGAAAVVVVNFILNFFIRVSNHCSAIAGALAMFFTIQGSGFPHLGLEWWVVGTVILAGLIGSVSILLNRHSLKEVLIGYASGFLPVILFSLIR